MADEQMEAAQKQLAANQAAQAKTKEEYEARQKGKPTPTQEENDLAALGATFTEHEDDGSGPDPYAAKQIEAKPGGGYQTRQVGSSRPAPHAAPARPPRTE